VSDETRCERCDTIGHAADVCWWHTQHPYGLSRWQQIDLLRSALGAATAALASLKCKPNTLAMCREAMAKTERSPPCDGPPKQDSAPVVRVIARYGPIEGDPNDPGKPTREAQEAHRLLMLLGETQRGLVLCWFCSGCYRHAGPGDYCTCQRDE
jgi:hypothetical protein